MGFFDRLFETPEEALDRVAREMGNRMRDEVLQQMPEIKKKCEALKFYFPYGYAQMEKKFQNVEYPYKEQYLSNSGEEIVVEECKLLKNGGLFGYSPLRSASGYTYPNNKGPKLKDEYYDIVAGKYVFSIGKAIKAFSLARAFGGYDPGRPERERREKEEHARQEKLRKEEEKRRAEDSELIRKGVSPQLYSILKPDSEQILKILKENNIECFYHFTSRKNIKSIVNYGGLFSWDYLTRHNIPIPVAGGGDTSRSLDKRYGLEDYVRLSFCSSHPMAQRLKEEGEEIVVLRIDVRAATWKDSLFSDINATDNDHHVGGRWFDLDRIDFDATQRERIFSFEDDFKKHQAEILVKTFVPIKYILTNLDYYV